MPFSVFTRADISFVNAVFQFAVLCDDGTGTFGRSFALVRAVRQTGSMSSAEATAQPSGRGNAERGLCQETFHDRQPSGSGSAHGGVLGLRQQYACTFAHAERTHRWCRLRGPSPLRRYPKRFDRSRSSPPKTRLPAECSARRSRQAGDPRAAVDAGGLGEDDGVVGRPVVVRCRRRSTGRQGHR